MVDFFKKQILQCDNALEENTLKPPQILELQVRETCYHGMMNFGLNFFSFIFIVFIPLKYGTPT